MIYWDYNAGAPLRAEVRQLLAESFKGELAGNPSSVHERGRAARARLDRARQRVARVLRCEPKAVSFTSSGSEAGALALKGAFLARSDPSRRRIVSSTIEHPSLLASLEQLKAHGALLSWIAPRSDGRVHEEDLLAELGAEVALCSLMWANNETGVLQPVAAAARACRTRGIVFHTDAVQAVGRVAVHFTEVDADLLSLSAHKFGGPAGTAVLVARGGLALDPLVPGHQEGGRRGGTQAVSAAEGLALALELADDEQARAGQRTAALRDRFEGLVQARVPDVRVNGAGAERLLNTSNLQFVGADGEALLMALDLEGIQVSMGAACASGSLNPSHVLSAMGLSNVEARASLRFSFGLDCTESDVEAVVQALQRHVRAAREALR